MPTKKQRRRREKSFRHEYDFVVEDDEGNEVTVDTSERKAERAEKQKATAKPAGGQKRGRLNREPPEPSWDRAMRRGGVMGGLMLLAFLFLFKNAPIGIRVAWGVFYAAAFIPLTYFIDRTAYRSYLKRRDRPSAKKR